MDKNQHALTLAFRKAKAKSAKIKELGIKPDMAEKEVEELIISLSKKKAEAEGTEWSEQVKGQRWYVESLVAYAALASKERLDVEYTDAFAEVATEAEMLAELEKVVA